MQKYSCYLFKLKQSNICYCVICITVTLSLRFFLWEIFTWNKAFWELLMFVRQFYRLSNNFSSMESINCTKKWIIQSRTLVGVLQKPVDNLKKRKYATTFDSRNHLVEFDDRYHAGLKVVINFCCKNSTS